MCLVECEATQYANTCPGCLTNGKKLPLLPVAVYLAQVDFEFVDEFWREGDASPELKDRMRDRIAHLRHRQETEFGRTADVPLVGRPPSDRRITVLN